MTLRVPLAVRLITSRGDRHITGDLRDLTFRSSVPGGFASAQASLSRPLTLESEEIAYYGRMVVYDTRSGRTAWEGRLEDPSRSAGPDGPVWDLVAVGPRAHASDRSVPLVYVDRSLEEDAWRQVDILAGQAKGVVSRGDGPSGTPVLRLAWDAGQSIATNNVIALRYGRLTDTGQWVARIGGDHTEGGASTALRVQIVARVAPLPGSDTVLETDAWTVGNSAAQQRYGIEHTLKSGGVDVRIINTGSAFTSANTHWSSISNVHVLGSRYLRDGMEMLSGYTSGTVLASEVVEDLLGRLLTQYDGATASIATTSHPIDQLAYVDGATPNRMFDDLMGLEPGYWWAAWEQLASGKHRFEWSQWPTSVRYEASVIDGYTSTGSADGLYNAVSVRWREANGRIRTTRRTGSVPALTAAGLTREASIDLGDEVGSASAAERAGDSYLAEHSSVPNAGRLTVARPILDTVLGRMVDPHEIRPGNLIRLRDISPRVDALNASARNGSTVMRLVEHEYRASEAAATLQLDSYAPSTARTLAQIWRRPTITRRR